MLNLLNLGIDKSKVTGDEERLSALAGDKRGKRGRNGGECRVATGGQDSTDQCYITTSAKQPRRGSESSERESGVVSCRDVKGDDQPSRSGLPLPPVSVSAPANHASLPILFPPSNSNEHRPPAPQPSPSAAHPDPEPARHSSPRASTWGVPVPVPLCPQEPRRSPIVGGRARRDLRQARCVG